MVILESSFEKNLTILGLARDGNVLYGPYNSDGTLWDNNSIDKCNGVYMDDNSYGYVSMQRPPYTIGCWGPLESECKIKWG